MLIPASGRAKHSARAREIASHDCVANARLAVKNKKATDLHFFTQLTFL
jgi:hypothetical protein